MNYLDPIYTEKADCQDCSRCVRNCPVKAIRVEDRSAIVMSELCILCGTCVEVCPAGAKQVRDDLQRVKQLLHRNSRVFVSLAPSFISEFPDISPAKLIHALRKLGFYGVSETALGAQEVSANVSERFDRKKGQIIISSACPTVVQLLKKYRPQVGKYITDFYSPVLAHCKLLRQMLGHDIGIVFIGPCIAKKYESDQHSDLLDLTISFKDLRLWLEQEKIDIHSVHPNSSDHFAPYAAEEGALYPIDGGMIASMKNKISFVNADFMAFSGISNILDALTGLELHKPLNNVFLELLACEGGCINGPQCLNRTGSVMKRQQVLDFAKYNPETIPRSTSFSINTDISMPAIQYPRYPDGDIKEVLRSIGKIAKWSELNCGGCGYDSCRDFAKAVLDGKAERSMCVSNNRKLAQSKSTALIRTAPNGVVICDEQLRIVECNEKFATILGGKAKETYANQGGLERVFIKELVPFYNLFQVVLEKGEDIIDKQLRAEHAILNVSIFTIEKNHLVGGIVQDITEPSVQKEQVINKAKQVIHKNLHTVQQIAYLLGENAAQTESLLQSIIDSFTTDESDL